MAGISTQLEKIDNLSLRERGILLAAGLLLIIITWFHFFHEPLVRKKEVMQTDIGQKLDDIDTLALQLDVLTSKKTDDPNVLIRNRREETLAGIEETRNQILEATSNLVAPEKMPELLRSVLARVDGLELVSLSGLGKTPLIEQSTDGEEGEDAAMTVTDSDKEPYDNAYKHGMKIVFEGDFFTTLDYIRKLESLNWRFFWDSIEFRVEQYPGSTSSVTLYTLSLDENWIGI